MSVSARLARRFAAEMARIGLSPESNVAVALSAGPDSMALTTLTAWWTRAAGVALAQQHLRLSCLMPSFAEQCYLLPGSWQHSMFDVRATCMSSLQGAPLS